MLAAFRLVLFWLYFTGARCAGPVSLPTSATLPTSSHLSTSTSSSSTSSQVMTSTASSLPSPTQTTFFINAINNMTTCTSGIITWTYNGSSADIILSITNSFEPYPQNTTGTNISLIDTNAASKSWTWPQVNVSQGWYRIVGAVSSFSAVSADFFVSNGSDTSCLISSGTSTASPTVNMTNGEIAGIVVGVLAGLVILALAIVYYLHRRGRPSRGHLGRDKLRKHVGRWSSMKSNSSNTKSLVGDNTGDLSTVHSNVTDLAGEIQISVADVKNPIGEKVHPDPIHAPPSSYDRHTSNPSTPVDRHHRRASELNFEQHTARIRSSMDSSMFMRTGRMSLPASPRTPSFPRERDEYSTFTASASSTSPLRERDEYPPSPVDFPRRGRDEYPPSPGFATSVSRSPSAGTAARRKPRKPVPQYDLSELRDPTLNTQLMLAGGDLQGTDPHPPLPPGVPALSPKTSFGNHLRMHYLMPDMPLPNNE